jgi:glycosyltransferase involved in cell wall biosynthesis
MEAGATGLPAIATHHAGIDDVVIDGTTGFLVNEFDARAMSERMLQLIDDPQLAGRMGRAARTHVEARFAMDDRIATLWQILDAALHQAAAGCRVTDARTAASVFANAGLSNARNKARS